MTTLSDTQIIDNTHFQENDDGTVECYTVLPGEDEFREKVPSREVVAKNMIGWCNTVREYLRQKEEGDVEERVAKKERRKSGAPSGPAPEPVSEARLSDPKLAVIDWYISVQAEIDELGEVIKEAKEKRNKLRDERDKIEPIVTAWKGSE